MCICLIFFTVMLSGTKCSRNIRAHMRRIKASPSEKPHNLILIDFLQAIFSRIKASPSGQFPRKTGEMSEMPSALNDKRGAPAAQAVEPWFDFRYEKT